MNLSGAPNLFLLTAGLSICAGFEEDAIAEEAGAMGDAAFEDSSGVVVDELGVMIETAVAGEIELVTPEGRNLGGMILGFVGCGRVT